MCNLQKITTNQSAIIDFTRARFAATYRENRVELSDVS
jgi:hypothetical protein